MPWLWLQVAKHGSVKPVPVWMECIVWAAVLTALGALVYVIIESRRNT